MAEKQISEAQSSECSSVLVVEEGSFEGLWIHSPKGVPQRKRLANSMTVSRRRERDDDNVNNPVSPRQLSIAMPNDIYLEETRCLFPSRDASEEHDLNMT